MNKNIKMDHSINIKEGKETLVELETAKVLKEIGFDYPVNTSFSETPVNDLLVPCEPDDQFGTSWKPKNYNDSKMWIVQKFSRPTQELAHKFIRDKYNVHINITIADNNKDYWSILESKASAPKILNDKPRDTYEKALELGLFTYAQQVINKK